MGELFAYGVDKTSVDAALTCLEAAVATGQLSQGDIRYILDRARKVILPRMDKEEAA